MDPEPSAATDPARPAAPGRAPAPADRVARAVRRTTAGARGAVALARTPGLVRGLAAGVGEGLAARVGLAGSARSGPEEGAGTGEHGVLDPDAAMPAPAGLDGFARHVGAARSVASPAAAVVEQLHSTGALASWLTLHAAYRGDVPEVLAEGDTLRQQILLMDIPAEARWRVEAADEHGLALRGTGPMGVTLALWLRVAPTDGGSVVRLDAGLDGAPLRGPVGTTATRSVEAALASSLVALSEALSGAAPAGPRLRVGSAPVLHRASGRMLEASTPVIVGVGQVVQRDPDPAARPDRDPVALAVEALRLAAEDAGAALDLLAAADHVYAVPSASWTYADQAALVAAGVGATPVATVQSSPYGGDGGQLVVNDAAEAVAEGRAHVVLLAGAEAGATVSRAQALGIELDWPRQPEGTAPTRTVGVDRVANTEAETGVGLGAPVYVYALLESAVRRRLGRSASEHLDHVARLWSRFSGVAAANPYAWSPHRVAAEDLATPAPDNRAVSAPYTKLLCANLQVDLATGTVLTSVAAAEAAGVPQERWVFVHAGASAHDEWFVSERDDLSRSPAIAAIGAAALAHAGASIEDVDLVDLYACFPSAVEIAADALGLPLDDPARPLTVTGGLTFAGGPGNNYGSHAVATMVPLLRARPGALGLSTSLGWYATKHALGLYSATPPERAFAHLRPVVDRPPRRPVLASYAGPAVVEAATLPYDRSGEPEAVVASLLTPTGERVLVRSEDPALVTAMVDDVLLGAEVEVAVGGGTGSGSGSGEERLVVTAPGRPGSTPAPLPAAPRPPVRTERRGAVLVVTLDRPEVRNAVDARTAEALEQAVDDAEADPGVRAIVLTGAGGTFCAGMDLRAAARGELPVTAGRGPLGLTGRPPTTPLVVAVEGAALAGGCELVLAADLVVAAQDATFGLPEARRGLVAAAGGMVRARERLPRNVAMELVLLGEPVDAPRLHALGLVNRLVAPGDALEEAVALAARIAGNAPLSVALGKRVVDESPGWASAEAFERQGELASAVLLSDDAREGVEAFAERRDPVWRGR